MGRDVQRVDEGSDAALSRPEPGGAEVETVDRAEPSAHSTAGLEHDHTHVRTQSISRCQTGDTRADDDDVTLHARSLGARWLSARSDAVGGAIHH